MAMSSVTHKLSVSVVFMAVVCLSSASAHAVPWGNSSGTAPSGHFTWDSGYDLYGSFGDPTVSLDDKFVFDSISMGVSAHNGHLSDSFSDSVFFNVHISPSWNLQWVEVRAYGDFLVQGAESQVALSATLAVQEFEAQPPQPNPRTWTDALTTTPVTFPLTCTGPTLQGTWAGISSVYPPSYPSGPTPYADADLHISVTNVLNAVAAQNGLANLNLNFQQARFEIILPEPMSLLLLGLGAMALLRRR
jgi:hypothetical protein